MTNPMTAPTASVPTSVPVVASPRRRGLTKLTGMLLAAAVFCVLMGLWHGKSGSASFDLSNTGDLFSIPDVKLPALLTCVVLGLVCAALAGFGIVRGFPAARGTGPALLGTLAAIVSFLVWAGSGESTSALDLVSLLGATVFLAVPLVLGAGAGIVSERTGVINVAIEGQMLGAAFLAAMTGTIAHNLYVGLAFGILAGVGVGALLGVFATRYQVNQVVLGVVINLLILGLTTYLYSRMLQPDSEGLNQPGIFHPISVPLLSRIPVIGPVLFSASILVYATYVIVVVLHVMLFRSRWGLRTRAVGEHPRAADTLGIAVNRLRFRNSLLAGALAGVAGAYLSIGSVGAFGINMSAGRGFIALAAVIFGRWTPLGSVGAALLFAFCSALNNSLSILGTPVTIPNSLLGSLPYLVTLLVVAGVVGRSQAPAADGVPYTKA
ncbi:MAG: ABC transporter permease [Nocardioidaceae bacterium]